MFAAAAILAGFVGLIWSADRFVAGAAAFALNFGLTPMLIGLTIVSFGTSAPEILVSLSASLDGSGDIAIGNAIGSNIANIGLVLAVTALIARIPVQKHILKDELPVLLIITAMAGWFLRDAELDRSEGWILLLSLLPAMAYMIWTKQRDLGDSEKAREEEGVEAMSTIAASLSFGGGLILLIISAKTLVWGAQTTAEFFEVNPLIIGLTVLAIGTSLPELAASAVSALRGHHDIALGNIIGSNIFNLLAVMSIPGIIQPLAYDPEVFKRDYLAMAGLTLFLSVIIAFAFLSKNNKPGFGRIAGGLLLLSYGLYCYQLYQDAV
ncbi:calcium/sodium antiporter [Agaribacterium haliotis]|uniref:calcium/sodium antiporter n=1 Tax=Agaribacterium haliotis TaxID=2013869 RepID=UPI001EFD572A|nr:calcium/sodium antiporter [Agaribacterium haliotis]